MEKKSKKEPVGFDALLGNVKRFIGRESKGRRSSSQEPAPAAPFGIDVTRNQKHRVLKPGEFPLESK